MACGCLALGDWREGDSGVRRRARLMREVLRGWRFWRGEWGWGRQRGRGEGAEGSGRGAGGRGRGRWGGRAGNVLGSAIGIGIEIENEIGIGIAIGRGAMCVEKSISLYI